ncbi:hypothetical protein NMG29_24810 [Streptomyces cocklensis]|uniref:Uncharacterized protein n=1 Tax=Actinacidiphila cocklensis TaxID=887465 RepID=A0A9W4GUZ9_9ACTN|nr:hypothetical protein [Actinacidiphila cocklensis]MDD1061399.1 hypothetical protein [Actinacidiphila cocklensis]WSX76762.1 hypothetical protein OH826_24785 [Streptomyces sp. NBC_00899]CAG6397407.1 hypothetical protein SCOCK_540008 [Actinacidiphila cocklensis]
MTTTANRRSGTEPVQAQSARDPRVMLSLICAPVLLIASGLLAWWASGAGPDGSASLSILAAICAVLFVVAAVDAAVLIHRGHHEPAASH